METYSATKKSEVCLHDHEDWSWYLVQLKEKLTKQHEYSDDFYWGK